MAPTEILAQQHYQGLAPLLENLGIRCALLTGSTTAKTKRSITQQLESGEIDFAIGTHALITGSVAYRDLGLVVTDEQHRFGVAQRAELAAKGDHPHSGHVRYPHPRTLALILYGDLDVSIIDQLPPAASRCRPSPSPGAITSGCTASSASWWARAARPISSVPW
ncbi:MAG: DEAD/DEAH box helicase [Dysosmobacter welbionis]